jgi:glycosyltransferase involved in cell wall biosynthesis
MHNPAPAVPCKGLAGAWRAQRIVFIGHTAALGGAELSLLDIAPHFAKCVVCLFEDGQLPEALRRRGVQVLIAEAPRALLRVRRNSSVLAALLAIPGVLAHAHRVARLTGPGDVIYANTQKAWIVAALVAWWRRRTAVWHLHDILSIQHFDRLLCRVGVFLANRAAAAVIVNSEATRTAFLEQGGISERVRVVLNGIDPAPFAAVDPRNRQSLRRELDLGNAVTVGLFGRIAPWKGQHVLLRALKQVPAVKALIVGSPLFGEHAYLEELKLRAGDRAVAGRVRFLGFRADVPALMNAVDIVVHTSIVPEPFGRVIVEGMLAERPVIAAGGGGVTEIIEDGIDGILVIPGDADGLAGAIDALVRDPARARRLALAGRQKAQQQFSIEKMCRGIAAAIGAT